MGPFEPSCLISGNFRDHLDFRLCRCETNQYLFQIEENAQCTAKRRGQMLDQVDKLIVETFNCRLQIDGCSAGPAAKIPFGILKFDFGTDPPRVPSCVDSFAAGRKFYNDFEAKTCRIDVQQFRDESRDWEQRNQRALEREAIEDADDALERFNCYANGDGFCR